jgi:hypothetical protein
MMGGLASAAVRALTQLPIAAKFDPWEVAPPGVWLIFGIVGLPVYIAFLGWFAGSPRNLKSSVLGSVVFLTFVTSLWGGLFALTMIIRLLFY